MEPIKAIDLRLEQLRSEERRLQDARRALTGTTTVRQRVAPRHHRVRSGSRIDQLVQIVRDNPGITVSAAAKLMPYPTQRMDTQIFTVRKHAIHRGLVTMDVKTGALTIPEETPDD